MPDSTISALSAAAALAGTEPVPIDQTGATVRTTVQAIADLNAGVPPSRTLTAGAGLAGGGDLTANRTFDVGAGTGITVSAGDVALTVPVAIAHGGTGTTTGTSAETTALLAGKANIDDPAFTGSMLFTGGAFAPASLAADQNDYFPDSADRRAIWVLTSSAAVNITGIDATTSNGRMLYVANINALSGFTITLKNESLASIAGNRFSFPADVVLYPNEGATLIRVSSRWRMFSPYGARAQTLVIAASDETTALTTGTAKVTFRMPYAMRLTAVRASLTTAQASGSIFTADINEGGVSLLSTKLTIDNTEKTSTTAAAAAVISDAVLADDAEITVDIDQVGDGTAKGLKVSLIGIPGQGIAALLQDRIEDALEERQPQ